jgi:hypothetical protein
MQQRRCMRARYGGDREGGEPARGDVDDELLLPPLRVAARASLRRRRAAHGV